jgi:hypothetical protein
MVFKIFCGSSDFILIFNILMRLMQKALKYTLLIGFLLQNGQIHLRVYLKNVKILLECHLCLVNLVWSTFGHCVKYIGVVSANYPRALLDSYSIERGTRKFVKRSYDWSECRRKISKNYSKKQCLWWSL